MNTTVRHQHFVWINGHTSKYRLPSFLPRRAGERTRPYWFRRMAPIDLISSSVIQCTYNLVTIQAERVIFNKKNLVLAAEGNVTIQDDKQRGEANVIAVSFKI